jgi:hypothetical protein
MRGLKILKQLFVRIAATAEKRITFISALGAGQN